MLLTNIFGYKGTAPFCHFSGRRNILTLRRSIVSFKSATTFILMVISSSRNFKKMDSSWQFKFKRKHLNLVRGIVSYCTFINQLLLESCILESYLSTCQTPRFSREFTDSRVSVWRCRNNFAISNLNFTLNPDHKINWTKKKLHLPNINVKIDPKVSSAQIT